MRLNSAMGAVVALFATVVAAFVFVGRCGGQSGIVYVGESRLPVQTTPAPLTGVVETNMQPVAPVGTVVAWLKSYANTPPLPAQWVECNGQTLNLPGSPYDGALIPNLNGSGNQPKRFLRGSTESGTIGGEETHNHGLFLTRRPANGGQVNVSSAITAPNIPPYYEVTWIMRVL